MLGVWIDHHWGGWFRWAPATISAQLAEGGKEIVVDSVTTFNFGGPPSKMTSKNTWALVDGGRELSIQRHVSSPRGEQNMTMIFSRL
jgi:hypothetical protein